MSHDGLILQCPRSKHVGEHNAIRSRLQSVNTPSFPFSKIHSFQNYNHIFFCMPHSPELPYILEGTANWNRSMFPIMKSVRSNPSSLSRGQRINIRISYRQICIISSVFLSFFRNYYEYEPCRKKRSEHNVGGSGG